MGDIIFRPKSLRSRWNLDVGALVRRRSENTLEPVGLVTSVGIIGTITVLLICENRIVKYNRSSLEVLSGCR